MAAKVGGLITDSLAEHAENVEKERLRIYRIRTKKLRGDRISGSIVEPPVALSFSPFRPWQ
jgi:hypothetical protein